MSKGERRVRQREGRGADPLPSGEPNVGCGAGSHDPMIKIMT